MDKDFSELVEYLDEKFQKTATKEDVAILAEKFLTIDEFDQFRIEVKEEFKELRVAIQSLTNAVDGLVKAVSDLKTEYWAINSQLTRHEKWIQQIAEKTGLKLEY